MKFRQTPSLKKKDALNVKQLRSLEEKAKKLGLGERLLIENASSNLARFAESLDLGKRIAVLSGKGNNGADVLAAARKLRSRGYKVKAGIVCENSSFLGSEVIFQKSILEKIAPVKVFCRNNLNELAQFIKGSGFIIDGLLGIGVKGSVSSFLSRAIGYINKAKKVVLACDIPSGLDPQTGLPLGAAVKADYTVTFIAPKTGFFLNNAERFCGKIIVADIGISRELLDACD